MGLFSELDAVVADLLAARRTLDFLVRNRPRGDLAPEYDQAIEHLKVRIEGLNQKGNELYRLQKSPKERKR